MAKVAGSVKVVGTQLAADPKGKTALSFTTQADATFATTTDVNSVMLFYYLNNTAHGRYTLQLLDSESAEVATQSNTAGASPRWYFGKTGEISAEVNYDSTNTALINLPVGTYTLKFTIAGALGDAGALSFGSLIGVSTVAVAGVLSGNGHAVIDIPIEVLA